MLLSVVVVWSMTACADATAPTDAARAEQPVPVTISISSADVGVGRRVAVTVALDVEAATVGGVQGRLHFDPSLLRYVGQAPVGDPISVVNASEASAGVVRFLSFSRAGVAGPVVLLVFEQRASGYASSLRYENQMAVSAGSQLRTLAAAARHRAVVDARISVPLDPRTISVTDWARASGSSLSPAVNGGVPTQRPAYGDIDGNGAIDIRDALVLASVSLGATQSAIGDDAGPDVMVAGNVWPVSIAGDCGIEPDDTRRLDLADVVAIVNATVGAPAACIGVPIHGETPLPTRRESIAVTAAPGMTIDSGLVVRLTSDRVWELAEPLRVRRGGVLRVDAGTRVEGLGPHAAIVVERGGRLLANGTHAAPIVFTCAAAVTTSGCWSGVFIAGRGIINNGEHARGLTGDGCAQTIGGITSTLYGGCRNADTSGIISYVRIEFAGAVGSPSTGSGALTLAGVGSGTQIDHLQVHGSRGMALRVVGGAVRTRFVMLTANENGLDISSGNAVDHQFIIIQNAGVAMVQSATGISSEGSTMVTAGRVFPRTGARLWNVTMIGGLAGASVTALQLRRGSGLALYNSVIAGWPVGLDLDDAQTCESYGTGAPRITHTTFIGVTRLGSDDGADPRCAGVMSLTAAEEQFLRAQRSNTVTAESVAALFGDAYNMRRPDFRMHDAGRPPVPSETRLPTSIPGSTAIATAFRGAVPAADDGLIPWYAGWTRGVTSPGIP
jgi:hypothetical protein